MSNVLSRLRVAVSGIVRPAEDITPVEWAKRHIVVTDGERQGKIRFDRGYEYQIDPLNEFFGDFAHGQNLITGCAYKGAQSGVTLICQIGQLFIAEHKRVSAAHMMPRSFDADDKAKKLSDMIDASPYLRSRIPMGLLRVRKTVAGQQLRICYSNSQAELKNWQAGCLVIDEEDECEAREFDSISMAIQRLGAYTRQRIIHIGTPTLPKFGMHQNWEMSDQRRWWVPCPMCGFEQTLLWEQNIEWDDRRLDDEAKAKTAKIVCADCRRAWDFRLREMANADGKWISQRESSMIGFGMNRIMVPTSIPTKMVENYLRGLRNDSAMREHYNQDRGECYLAMSGKLAPVTIRQMIDPALDWGRVPGCCSMVTVGIDVQGLSPPFDYVWEVRAYDSDGKTHLIHYGIGDDDALVHVIGDRNLQGLISVHRGLIDITAGQHKSAVEALCQRIPILRPARFDPYRKTKFGRGKIVKVKRGHDGFALNEDDALDDVFSRFFCDPPTMVVAGCPNGSLEASWVDHYTHIARVRQQRASAHGDVYTYRKLRPTEVDYPYAGALAEYAHRHFGRVLPGGGSGLGVSGQSAKEREKKGIIRRGNTMKSGVSAPRIIRRSSRW